jgi:hypothetical protein
LQKSIWWITSGVLARESASVATLQAADGRLKASPSQGRGSTAISLDDVIRVLAQNIARPEEIEVGEASVASPAPA